MGDIHFDVDWLVQLISSAFGSMVERLYVFLDPSQGLFIGYILSAFAVALAFQAYKHKSINFVSLSKDIIRSHKLNSKSSLDDLYLYIVDKIILGFIYSLILSLSFYIKHGVLDVMGFIQIPHFNIEVGLLLSLVLTLGAIIVFDFATFTEHYFAHKVRVLWEFHKIHHIAENLNPLTAYRSHPVNQIMFVLIVSLFSGTYSGVINHLFPNEQLYIVIAGQNAFMFMFLLFGLNLQHSHIFLKYPRVLRDILVSPAYHQLHHSSLKKHHDINFGFIFSFWDRLLKTQVMPDKEEKLIFGVSGEKYENYSGIIKLYITPIKRVHSRIVKHKKTSRKSIKN